jgi:two-component sensor histidine kinase
MTESQQAAELLLSLPELFPRVKRYIFHYAPRDSHPPIRALERRYSSAADLERAVSTITELLPRTKRIVAVLDRSTVGTARAEQLRDISTRLRETTTLELWDDFLEDELYARARLLPQDTAILYLPVQRDRQDRFLVPGDVARRLAEASSVPVFSHFDTLLGTGIVGGYMVSAFQLGWMMGRTAAYGESAAPFSQEDYAAASMGYYFDERALKRWNIATTSLPDGSRILYRDKTFIEKYGAYLAIVAALFALETMLVFSLIRSGIRRKRAITLLDVERATLEEKVLARTADLALANEGLCAEVEERKRAQAKEQEAARELEMMLKEFQHRVKNGLGIITSLVSLEAGRIDDKEGQRVLRNLEARIAAISTLYDMLYATGGVMEVAADVYLENLIENLATSLGADARGIGIITRLDPFPIDIKRAISLALVANELVTNAFKYAFPGERSGSIEVCLSNAGENLRFEVIDDGVGLPADFEPETSTGLGMTLVVLLARQLEGSLTWSSVAGSRFALVFPK